MINTEIDLGDGALGNSHKRRATANFHCAGGADETCLATTISNMTPRIATRINFASQGALWVAAPSIALDISPQLSKTVSCSLSPQPDSKPSAPPQKYKKVNAGHRKSRHRAAVFMRDFTALSEAEAAASIEPNSGGTSVRVDHKYPHLSIESDKNQNRDHEHILPILSHEESAGGPPKGPTFPIWWRSILRDMPTSPKPHRNPPLWRQLPNEALIDLWHDALAQIGDVITITGRLRDDIECQARRQPKPIEWLRRRFARELKKGFGRGVECFLRFEEDDNRRLHVHGELGIGLDDAELARLCFRRAGGEWHDTRQRQAHTHDYAPDLGWASYCSEGVWWCSPFMRALLKLNNSRIFGVTFEGSPVSVTQGLNRRAKALYKERRLKVMKARSSRRGKTIECSELTATNTVQAMGKNRQECFWKLVRPATRVAPVHITPPRIISSPKIRDFVSFETGKSRISSSAVRIPTQFTRARTRIHLNMSHQAKDVFSQGPPSLH